MKTVQMTLDEDLVRQVDRAVDSLGTSRSAFTRDALRAALERRRVQEMEEQHRKGYARHPVEREEFDPWEPEQVWGDE